VAIPRTTPHGSQYIKYRDSLHPYAGSSEHQTIRRTEAGAAATKLWTAKSQCKTQSYMHLKYHAQNIPDLKKLNQNCHT
jgi:hypothetical protein